MLPSYSFDERNTYVEKTGMSNTRVVVGILMKLKLLDIFHAKSLQESKV